MILMWTTPCSTSRTPPPWLQDRSAFRCTRSRLDHDYDDGGSRDGDFFMVVVLMMIVVVVMIILVVVVIFYGDKYIMVNVCLFVCHEN